MFHSSNRLSVTSATSTSLTVCLVNEYEYAGPFARVEALPDTQNVRITLAPNSSATVIADGDLMSLGWRRELGDHLCIYPDPYSDDLGHDRSAVHRTLDGVSSLWLQREALTDQTLHSWACFVCGCGITDIGCADVWIDHDTPSITSLAVTHDECDQAHWEKFDPDSRYGPIPLAAFGGTIGEERARLLAERAAKDGLDCEWLVKGAEQHRLDESYGGVARIVVPSPDGPQEIVADDKALMRRMPGDKVAT
jgi:hypothetical protein